MGADQYLIPFRRDAFEAIVVPTLDRCASVGMDAIIQFVQASPEGLNSSDAAALLAAAEQPSAPSDPEDPLDVHPLYDIGSILFRVFCRVKVPEVYLTYSDLFRFLCSHEDWERFLMNGTSEWLIEACLGPGSSVVPQNLVLTLTAGDFYDRLRDRLDLTEELLGLARFCQADPGLGMALVTEW